MSYCRFSSNDFDCDVYAYESCYGGYQIHMAGLRVKGEVPRLLDVTKVSREEFLDAYKKQSEFLKTCEHEPIGLKYDDMNFWYETIDEFYEKMKELREVGYHIPDRVFTMIQEEIKEKSNAII